MAEVEGLPLDFATLGSCQRLNLEVNGIGALRP